MDAQVQQTIAAEIIRRRRAIIVAAVVTAYKRKRALEQRKRRLWSREWLLRRDTGQNVLNMVFGELGYVSITFSLYLLLNFLNF